jgi:hypothetical protein
MPPRGTSTTASAAPLSRSHQDAAPDSGGPGPGLCAPKPRHAVFEHAARQELPELALDELRQARAVAGFRHRAQEYLQVLGDGLVKHGELGVAGPVDRSLEGHGPQVG